VIGKILLFSTFFAAGVISTGSAKTFEVGRWSYACMHDHKGPYGEVRNPRNCWAIICEKSLIGCVPVFSFTEKRSGISRIDKRDSCNFGPSKIAVDGKRIDLLNEDEQVKAVINGKSMTREMWALGYDGGWPHCLYRDVTISIVGANDIYQRLLKLKPSYLP
jgi:hypothetical protein